MASREVYYLLTSYVTHYVYVCLVYWHWVVVAFNRVTLPVDIGKIWVPTDPNDVVFEFVVKVLDGDNLIKM